MTDDLGRGKVYLEKEEPEEEEIVIPTIPVLCTSQEIDDAAAAISEGIDSMTNYLDHHAHNDHTPEEIEEKREMVKRWISLPF